MDGPVFITDSILATDSKKKKLHHHSQNQDGGWTILAHHAKMSTHKYDQLKKKKNTDIG